MSDDEDDVFEFGHVTLLAKSSLAIRCQLRGGNARWFPKAVVHDNSEIYGDSKIGDSGKLVLQLWWADKEGLVK